MNKLLTILLIFITSLSFAQVKDTLKVGQYAISTLGTNDYVNKMTVPTIITSKYGVVKADTVFYVPSTAPNDTITTLMNARPSKKRAAIVFQRGSTRNTSILVSKDSITFASYGSGEKPKLSTLTTATNWTKRSTTDVYVTKVTNSITPEILTVNGVQFAKGRTPNANRFVNLYADYYHIDSHSGTTQITDSECNAATTDWDNAEIVIRTGNHMNWLKSTISNHTGTTLTFTNSASLTITDGYGYFIQNDLRTLDQFGEWYFNPSTDSLYFYGNPSGYTVAITTSDKIIDINNKDYVALKNLQIEGANDIAVDTRSSGTYGLSIDNCNFKLNNLGFKGQYAYETRITNSTFTNHNYMAVFNSVHPDGAYFANNIIDSTGLVIGSGTSIWGAGTGVTIDQGTHTESTKNIIIEKNQIKNSGYMGLVFAGDSAIVRKNYIDNYNLNRSDGGAIYYGGQTSYVNMKIQDNIVLNGNISDETKGTATNTAAWASYNIYIDYNSTGGILIDGNTSAHTYGAGIMIHMSDYVTITNNTIYDCITGVRFQELTGYSHPVRNITMNNNKVVSKKPSQETLSYRSLNNDFALTGTINNNYYAKPFSINPVFVTMVNTFTKTGNDFTAYKAATSQDASSTVSTIQIQNDDSIRFYTNPTNASVVYALNDTLRDITGAYYNTSVTIPAWGSKVLWNDDLVAYTPKNLGVQTVGGSTALFTTRTAVPYTFTENGTVVAMMIYSNMNGSSKANRLLMAAYDNTGSSGKPGTKLAETNTVLVSDITGWMRVNLKTPLTVTNGQTVWLAWIMQKTASTYSTAGTPGYAWTTGNTWADGLPTTYGTSTQNNSLFSLYFIYK